MKQNTIFNQALFQSNTYFLKEFLVSLQEVKNTFTTSCAHGLVKV